jgi:hypothetical protein
LINVKSDPNCPGSEIRKGASLDSWDIVHKDKGSYSFAHISKARWEEIFGDNAKGRRTNRDKAGM